MALVHRASQVSPSSLTSTEMLVDLVRRCAREEDLRGAFATIAAYCGFDAFSYLLLAEGTGMPTVMHHWTSACAQWQARYAERKYHAMDPRILLTQGRCVPVLWHAQPRDDSRLPPPFLADAARFGIRSGIAVAFDDARIGRVVLAWDSAHEPSDERAAAIADRLAELMLLAGYLREAMLAHCHAALVNRPDVHLTARERECIAFAARGMTSADIGRKLGITKRTVNFHFGNVMGKLGVLNRAEAIVRAIGLRIVPPV